MNLVRKENKEMSYLGEKRVSLGDKVNYFFLAGAFLYLAVGIMKGLLN